MDSPQRPNHHDGRQKFSSLDHHFSTFLSKLAKKNNTQVKLAAALLCRLTAEGHTCLDLSVLAGTPQEETASESDWLTGRLYPSLDEWSARLIASAVVGGPEDQRPLVLDHNRLYLRRYWEYEKIVVDFIARRISGKQENLGEKMLTEKVLQLFPGRPSQEPDWQQIAAITAAMKLFCVITGGPGTGKTSTVVKILALLTGETERKILLAAPTGKAAARLQQAIAGEKKKLPLAGEAIGLIPDETTTLHRLLRPVPQTPHFRFNENNLLTADVVIVDEASMVDLPLMAKLMLAIGPQTSLILIGDRNQLASVAPGSVFADICNPIGINMFSKKFTKQIKLLGGADLTAGIPPPLSITENCGLHDSIIELRENYRFSLNSGIMKLGKAINQCDIEGVKEISAQENLPDIHFRKLPEPNELSALLTEKFLVHFSKTFSSQHPLNLFDSFQQFRILCGLRKGPYGVENINKVLELSLAEHTMVKGPGLPASGQRHYPGQPIMISRNNHALRLYNGDVGIISMDPDAPGRLCAFFQNQEKEFRKISTYSLPEHETVYALTVHKSQGSEFDHILLILPDRHFPVLTRELLYTAVSRARKSVEIWCHTDVLHASIRAAVKRSSGLGDLLWGRSNNG